MPTNAPLVGQIDRSQHEVLVVDDNPATRYATARLLRSVGFRTREAGTGTDALDAADTSISAMVLDVHLPDIDGFEVCRILRSRSDLALLPVLHLSAAYVTDEDKVRGLDAGADAYLTHPVEPAVLVATVQALIRARMAEEAMRRSEAKFRALYAQAPSGICTLDVDGRFADANPALLALLKRPLGAVVGRRISDFAPPGWVERIDALGAQGGWIEVFPLVDGSGAELHVEWRVSAPLEPNVSIGVAVDVSERVSLERTRVELLEREQAARGEAERVNRMKDDLIAVLSHELRTPLNAIMGWAHVLQRRGGTPEAMRGLQAIERNSKIQARLISDILDVSSINMGKLRLKLERADPAALLISSLDTMRPMAEDGQHALQLDIEPGLGDVMADPGRLQQVVWNLVSNAIKFSPRGGEIRIGLHARPNGVRLSVADDGKGIEPEFLPYLFDRFTQSDATSNRAHGGLGLGLSIVKHLVQLHGGSVSAASEGAGRGAVFEVELPLADAPGGVAADSTHAAADAGEAPDTLFDDIAEPGPRDGDSLQGIDVLLVDDDLEACAMLQLILSDRGATVRVANDYEGALQALRQAQPDVLVSDVGMPGKDGYALLREVRAKEAGAAHLPAVALTSFTRPQDVKQAMAAGFDAHVGKPLRALELVRAMAKLVASARGAG